MSDRFFLDTNIFVSSFDKSAPEKARRAFDLIRRAIEKRQGIVSYQVVQEFFNLALRRFDEPMSPTDAEQYLSTTFNLSASSKRAVFAGALQSGLTTQGSVLALLV